MSAPSASDVSAKPAVSVLGLGMMGTALAAAFLEAGHPVTVWNRTAAKTGPLVAQGATPAATPADAIAASELVVLCLMINDNVREVLDTAPELLKGRTVANLTNGTPAQSRELAAWAAVHGVRYLDGGIMAVPQMIAGPHAYVFYSGDKEAFAEHEETFRVLGGARYVGEDAGFASLYDFALLIGMYGMNIGVLHSLALARSAGIPAKDIAGPVQEWVTAMAGALPTWADELDSGEHVTNVSSIAVNQAALPNLLNTLAGQGVSTEFFQPLTALLDEAMAAGHSADSQSRLAVMLSSNG
ncbi:NAD(P)-dependent oxidoreductase [Streptomyces sp. NPDC017979]|uniref:NAD(P)-dependent oxidoreductase n=1 Tax=Streptomyces sp. NPDC017979 TaxID=3365024 RepID=UPI0037AB0989